MKSAIAAVFAFSLLLAPAASFAGKEKQPHMHSAMEHLKKAKEALEKASDDKGGHRVEAIKAVDEAMKHVEEGIKFDNEHQSPGEKK